MFSPSPQNLFAAPLVDMFSPYKVRQLRTSLMHSLAKNFDKAISLPHWSGRCLRRISRSSLCSRHLHFDLPGARRLTPWNV